MKESSMLIMLHTAHYLDSLNIKLYNTTMHASMCYLLYNGFDLRYIFCYTNSGVKSDTLQSDLTISVIRNRLSWRSKTRMQYRLGRNIEHCFLTYARQIEDETIAAIQRKIYPISAALGDDCNDVNVMRHVGHVCLSLIEQDVCDFQTLAKGFENTDHVSLDALERCYNIITGG